MDMLLTVVESGFWLALLVVVFGVVLSLLVYGFVLAAGAVMWVVEWVKKWRGL